MEYNTIGILEIELVREFDQFNQSIYKTKQLFCIYNIILDKSQ